MCFDRRTIIRVAAYQIVPTVSRRPRRHEKRQDDDKMERGHHLPAEREHGFAGLVNDRQPDAGKTACDQGDPALKKSLGHAGEINEPDTW